MYETNEPTFLLIFPCWRISIVQLLNIYIRLYIFSVIFHMISLPKWHISGYSLSSSQTLIVEPIPSNTFYKFNYMRDFWYEFIRTWYAHIRLRPKFTRFIDYTNYRYSNIWQLQLTVWCKINKQVNRFTYIVLRKCWKMNLKSKDEWL